MAAIRLLEYLDAEGRSPYGAWFDGLNAPAAAKVAAALYQLAAGNRSNVKGDRKSTRLNSSHIQKSRMPSSA